MPFFSNVTNVFHLYSIVFQFFFLPIPVRAWFIGYFFLDVLVLCNYWIATSECVLVGSCCLHWGRLQARKGPNLKLGANWERGHKPLPYHPNENLIFQFFQCFSFSPNGLVNRSSFYSALSKLHSLLAQFQWVMNVWCFLQAKLRVYNSKWTRSFSMDTVGSNGVIICNDKERNRKYQVQWTL